MSILRVPHLQDYQRKGSRKYLRAAQHNEGHSCPSRFLTWSALPGDMAGGHVNGNMTWPVLIAHAAEAAARYGAGSRRPLCALGGTGKGTSLEDTHSE